jgi:hypothetical protein
MRSVANIFYRSPCRELEDNLHSGPIPSEIGKLTALSNLYLSSIDVAFASNNLSFRGLGRNLLTGAIPSELGNLNLLVL